MTLRSDSGRTEEIRLVQITTHPSALVWFLRGQTRYMQEHGFRVHAISSPGDQLVAFRASECVEIHAIDMPRRVTPMHDIGAVRRIMRVLRQVQPHIVHANTPKGGLLGVIAGRLTRTPACIYHIRGLPYMAASGRRRALLKATEWVSCRLADRVFCVSHSIREVAIRDGICPADRIVVFLGGSGNGVDASGRFNPARHGVRERSEGRCRLGIPDDAFVIGYVGRLVRDKGVGELAEAWVGLKRTHPGAHLVLVGPLEPQDPIDPETLKMLRADPQVHVTGPFDDTSALYPVFDLVALPSYREGFPNVLLEAAAMQLPVVASRIPGCTDAVEDGATGTLVPSHDATALGEAIRRYMNEPEMARRHGEAARRRVLEQFRQEDIWAAVREEYSSLLRRKGVQVSIEGDVAG